MSQLTVAESIAIVRHHNYGLNVTERLYTEALGVLYGVEPIAEYATCDSEWDDDRQQEAQELRHEQRIIDIEREGER